MTKEEAIRMLSNRDAHGVPCGYTSGYQEAFDMAIEALQREIPKNPVVNFVADSDGARRLNEAFAKDSYVCPVCHTYFGEVFDEGYCRKCGQKLIQKRVRVIEK